MFVLIQRLRDSSCKSFQARRFVGVRLDLGGDWNLNSPRYIDFLSKHAKSYVFSDESDQARRYFSFCRSSPVSRYRKCQQNRNNVGSLELHKNIRSLNALVEEITDGFEPIENDVCSILFYNTIDTEIKRADKTEKHQALTGSSRLFNS